MPRWRSLLPRVPIVTWLPRYRREFILDDIIAGGWMACGVHAMKRKIKRFFEMIDLLLFIILIE